ncbi:type II secretion protein F [Paenibacillus macerans]|uniref:Type II secretion protein F n=1 Tax=Paenibacillus macerans TaxID=44252 RepID=A0A6N8EXR9_PAEMA|nr:type II secretion system F family protein [Paenibacillus macerans]MEC0331656.1 type II secretion system F family protein [Paenibacillus macerans]MUG24404.1 type II secretion protein F [Paenibacillus macerans]UMV50244.1 type II secretion system F family protein [Paenibacillus macerans]
MFLMLWGILLVLLGGWGWGYRISFRRYSGYTRFVMEGLRLQRLSPPMLYLLERGKVSRRFPGVFFKVNRAVQKICGDRRSGEFTLLFLAETLTYSWLLLTLGCVLSLLMNGDSSGLVIGAVLALLLPAALIHDLHRKVVRREHAVILELPELLNKIVLLVGAGSTVQQAIKLCLERKREQENHPLYRELFQMMREWEGGYSFQQAMEGFSKRCGIQEVSAFTTAVLLNYRRGGHDFALALRDLSHSLWEKRKAVSKTLGEQASSKLVFPMVLMFMAILLLVGAPAFMIMDL